ncbi:hypothetical protein [Halosimplex amylolyticum]|uniref:hypothetical protein n=1 Tax=Halosimplex amylolyticum TaxID=3396616 RepID=UPI003F563470
MTDDHDDSLAERVERLHDALRATEERPVEREASRWIGEAQAVAGDASDVATTGGDAGVVRERVGHVADLLANVEETGDDAADERVATARELAERIADGE